MIDKLDVLSLCISKYFARLAEEEGQTGIGYERWVDLRETEASISAILYFRGRHGGIHKLALVGVARLGWSNTQRIIRRVFGRTDNVRIHRIDVCVDIPGKSVWQFAEETQLSRTQNFRLYRERGSNSVYLQASKSRRVVVYDRAWLLRKKKHRLAKVLNGEELTRIEVQLSGGGVPFRRLKDLPKYQDIDLLSNLALHKFRDSPDKEKPMQLLARIGLRALVSKYGLQGASKMFTAPAWAFLKRKFLQLRATNEAAELSRRMKESTRDWMLDRIRSPRFER